ncbi:MAG: hypothetical protein QMD22_11190 [archaeon]|nr:hypothetical protein [archaeon]
MRLSLRKTLETTVNDILSLDELRKKDTIEERKKVQRFSDVIKYYDELKILPMLEGMNKLKVVPDITEEEVVEAEKALQELKK